MAPVGTRWRQLAELMQERGVDTVAELGVEVAAEFGERLRVVPREAAGSETTESGSI